MQNYNKFMKKCFNLAKKGEGKVSPNPLVGSVLTDKTGKIVSTGYHKGYGLDHAEVDCIKNYEKNYGKNADYSDLTLYVNLEPCNHYGKTPPCTDLILEKKIKKVVIGIKDPNPDHSGGIEKLKKAGVEIIEDVLKDEALKINEVFFKNAQQNFPFVAIKTATTLDGKIASKTSSSKWITSESARKYVQKLRNRYDGILTSSNTVISDNPSLTARGKGLKNPVRIILDSHLKTNPNSKVYNNDGIKVLLFHTGENLINNPKDYPKNVKLIKVRFTKNKRINLKEALKIIYNEKINSILVEAGGILFGEFIKQNLADKIYHFIAPKTLGDINAKSFIQGFDISDIKECRNYKITTLKILKPDVMFELYPIY